MYGPPPSAAAFQRLRVESGHSVLFAPALPRQLKKLDSFDFLLLDDLGYLPQGTEECEVLFTLIAERY